MKLYLGIIATILVASVSAMDLGRGGVKEVTASRANATACRTSGIGKLICKFNSNDLKLEDEAAIHITVKPGGRQIKCMRGNKSKRNSWYEVLCSLALWLRLGK